MSKTIVLFDMDGTLTEPRQKFDFKLLSKPLYDLINLGVEIGIITGSDEDYLNEQMGRFLKNTSCRYKTHLLPCNGTKYFKPPMYPDDDYKLVHEVSMEQHLGENNYRDLLCELVCSQLDVCHIGAPLTGHFINCRGSMINWSPIGRNASAKQRQQFIKLDKEKKIRKHFIYELRAMLDLKDLDKKITIKLGGDTSFDIYPVGWDKTYGLRHFNGWNTWFVGDRCEHDGNDYEIFNSCHDRSYKTNGPKQTVEIIQKIIDRIRGENE